MEIIEFNKQYENQVKDLLVELQEYIVSIDKFALNILTKEYRNKYYKKTINEVYNNNGKIFLAKEDDKIWGLIAGFVTPYNKFDKLDYKCPKKATISELIVSKHARGRHIGKSLLTFAENYFKKNGCKYIALDVFAYNINAEKFYNCNGYESRMIQLFKKL